MIHDKVSISIILDKRRQKKDKTYPVKIRATFKGQPRYYGTGHDLTESDFDRVMGDRPRGNAKVIRDLLDTKKARANTTYPASIM